MELLVEFISGDNKGRKYSFSEEAVTVGRSDRCSLSLASDLVSYEHCRFSVKADGLYLTDLGSSNGTYVNGTLHTAGFISSGDTVAFGKGGPEAKVTFKALSGKPRQAGEPAKRRIEREVLVLSVKGGKGYRFKQSKILLGRDDACDVSLDHSVVSREHAQIDIDEGKIVIRDLKSTNGTFVNGRKVESAVLGPGDVIILGENGPELVIGTEHAKIREGRRNPLPVIIPVVLILAAVIAGYFLVFKPSHPTRQVLSGQSLHDYVYDRLKDLSTKLSDPETEIPPIFVESVIRHINRFTGGLRSWFEASLKRMEMHDGMVFRLLRGAGLPEEFAYLAFVESGYSTTAKSRVGAMGLWQLMPGTARDFGLTVIEGVRDERQDPKKSTEAACKYIKQLYNLYNSYLLAMASYNAGEGRVASALRKIDVIEKNRFWYLVKNDMLHKETIDYVPQIMAVMIIATDPEKFGFTYSREQ